MRHNRYRSSGNTARHRRRDSQQSQNKTAVKIMMGVGLFFFLLVMVNVMIKENPYDENTFCPIGKVIHQHAVLIDNSDPINENQKRTIKRVLKKIRDSLLPQEELRIYVLDHKNFHLADPEFAKCNPGNADDANELYQNPNLIRKRFNDFFLAPLNDMIDGLNLDASGDFSPIFKMIETVAEGFNENANDAIENGLAVDKEITIISNFMENTPLPSAL